ncbi:hypothetical protein BH24ACT16_BH24ACT16_05610 [soil metagenome]
MQEDRANYGRPTEPGDELSPGAGGYGRESGGGYEGGHARTGYSPMRGTGSSLSPSDERSWSALSHLSVLVWPVTGLLPVAPLIIWLVYRNSSPRVGFHALQSVWYQAAWLALGAVGGVAATVFLTLTLGLGILLVAPLAAVFGILPFVHQLYAAYKVSQGVDYRYPFIANMLDGERGER